MRITPAWLSSLTGVGVNSNMRSVISGCAAFPNTVQWPHLFAVYIGQLGHESLNFLYDREIWGPTAAQRRYEGRVDLGNTQVGDGYRFRGRGPIQVTGRTNYTLFRNWCRARFPEVPDFAANPDAVNIDPWEGLTAIWFWTANRVYELAERNDVRAVTRRISGGYNGLADRQVRTDEAMVRLLGTDSLRQAQRIVGVRADGIIGPVTRTAMFNRLRNSPALTFIV